MSNQQVRINERIRISPVLAINGEENLGIISTDAAMKIARGLGLDLVEVSPNARPPVCRIMDFGKFKYEQKVKTKNQKKAKAVQIKEVHLRPVTGTHDIEVKTKAIRRFLESKDIVHIKMYFEKREIDHKDLGFSIIDGIIANLKDIGEVRSRPAMQSRTLICVLEPRN